MVRTWLGAPHVRQWWGEPDEQFGLVSEGLEHSVMDQDIVVSCGVSFAYLHGYEQSGPENDLGVHPPGSRGIDQFIGEPGMVRAFVDGLLRAAVPRVLADPDPANARAIRADARADFRSHGEVGTPDGRALLMIRDNPCRVATP
jgi:aminoglycoside 6'-N-acetyltransferase